MKLAHVLEKDCSSHLAEPGCAQLLREAAVLTNIWTYGQSSGHTKKSEGSKKRYHMLWRALTCELISYFRRTV